MLATRYIQHVGYMECTLVSELHVSPLMTFIIINIVNLFTVGKHTIATTKANLCFGFHVAVSFSL